MGKVVVGDGRAESARMLDGTVQVDLDPTVASPRATSPEKGGRGTRRGSSDRHDRFLRHEKRRNPVRQVSVAKPSSSAIWLILFNFYRPLAKMALGDTTVGSRPSGC